MKKGNIDLKARTFGEKWFERAVNYAPGLWYPIAALILGIVITIVTYVLRDTEDRGIAIHIGPFWIMFSLVFFERYHARKAIERLIADGDPVELNNPQEDGTDS